jgi:hypothetical protein
MKVGYSSVVWIRHSFKITSSVTLWIAVTKAGDCVKRLVEITYIVDNQTKGKGLLILFIREVACDLRVVRSSFVVTSVHHPLG